MSDYALMIAVLSSIPVTITGTLMPILDGKDIQKTIMIILRIFTIVLFICLFAWAIMQTNRFLTADIIEVMRNFCLEIADRIISIADKIKTMW